MEFTKMHGCGNDYIYIWLDEDVCALEETPDCIRALYEGAPDEVNPQLADFVRGLSDRHFGVGADGVIFIRRYRTLMADFEMLMYNADGSRGQMCGNGIRCVAKFVFEHGRTAKKRLEIVSCGAQHSVFFDIIHGVGMSDITVDMGAPAILAPQVPVTLPTLPYYFTPVSMGNPHAVVFLPQGEALDTFDVAAVGRQFERHPNFPDSVNTEFVIVDAPNSVRMRVWERGSGETLCCGTGCCAVCVAGALNGLTADNVTVHALGGDVLCEWNREQNTVYMTGPATTVFEGDLIL